MPVACVSMMCSNYLPDIVLMYTEPQNRVRTVLSTLLALLCECILCHLSVIDLESAYSACPTLVLIGTWYQITWVLAITALDLTNSHSWSWSAPSAKVTGNHMRNHISYVGSISCNHINYRVWYGTQSNQLQIPLVCSDPEVCHHQDSLEYLCDGAGPVVFGQLNVLLWCTYYCLLLILGLSLSSKWVGWPLGEDRIASEWSSSGATTVAWSKPGCH